MSFALCLGLQCSHIYGVAAGVSELIDEGRHREYRDKCSQLYIFSLVFEGGKRFWAIGLASV